MNNYTKISTTTMTAIAAFVATREATRCAEPADHGVMIPLIKSILTGKLPVANLTDRARGGVIGLVSVDDVLKVMNTIIDISEAGNIATNPALKTLERFLVKLHNLGANTVSGDEVVEYFTGEKTPFSKGHYNSVLTDHMHRIRGLQEFIEDQPGFKTYMELQALGDRISKLGEFFAPVFLSRFNWLVLSNDAIAVVDEELKAIDKTKTTKNAYATMNSEALSAADTLEMILGAQWSPDNFELKRPGVKIGVIDAGNYVKALEVYYDILKGGTVNNRQAQLVSQLNREWSAGLMTGIHPALNSGAPLPLAQRIIETQRQFLELEALAGTLPQEKPEVEAAMKFLDLVKKLEKEKLNNDISVSTLGVIAHDLMVYLNLLHIRLSDEKKTATEPKNPIPGFIERLNKDLHEVVAYMDSKSGGNRFDMQARSLIHSLFTTGQTLKEVDESSDRYNAERANFPQRAMPSGFRLISNSGDIHDLLNQLGLGNIPRV